jgi:hypothetical protein
VQSCYSTCLFRLVFSPGTLHLPGVPVLVAWIHLVSQSWYLVAPIPCTLCLHGVPLLSVSFLCSRLGTLYRLVSQSRYLVSIWCPIPGTLCPYGVPLLSCIYLVSQSWYLVSNRCPSAGTLYLPDVPVLVPCFHLVSQSCTWSLLVS